MGRLKSIPLSPAPAFFAFAFLFGASFVGLALPFFFLAFALFLPAFLFALDLFLFNLRLLLVLVAAAEEAFEEAFDAAVVVLFHHRRIVNERFTGEAFLQVFGQRAEVAVI
jgi:hypothetical protein